MRHGHASLLVDAGVRDKVISERLSHRDEQLTRNVYIHSFAGAQDKAAQKVDRLLRKQKGAR